MKKTIILLFLLFILLIACKNPGKTYAGNSLDNTSGYQLVKAWPQLPEGFVLGNPSGIGIDSAQNVFVFCRAGKKWPLLLPFSESVIREKTILELDGNSGRLLNSWGAGLFIMPHSLTVDKDNNIWVTDVGLQQVLKFSHEGKLLMRVGEAKVSGDDSAHFNRPTDVAVAADGSFYVSDGYRNSRVVKFSASGHYLFSWGKKGDKSGEFNLPHGITLDDEGNVYVADRQNNRIQVFDSKGRFLKEWKDGSFGNMYAIRFDKTAKKIVAADYITDYLSPLGSDILIFDRNGILTERFGRSGYYDGPVCRYHDLATDNSGNIYAGDILGNRIQKFRKIHYQ
jgi:peptidylamidoglycolate lyase